MAKVKHVVKGVGAGIAIGATAVAGAVMALDLRTRGHATLLFDDDCAFCRRFVRWAQARDARVTFVACQDAMELRARYGIADEQCQEAAWLDDGDRLHRGAAAINEVLRRLPGWPNLRYRLGAAMMRPKPLLEAEQAAYHWISQHRSRIEGEIQRIEAQ